MKVPSSPNLRLQRLFALVLVAALTASVGVADDETERERPETRISAAVEDSDGFLVHKVTSPYQSGETGIRVLLPSRRTEGGHRTLYVLPVEAGNGTHWGDGLLEVRRAGLHERFGLVCVAPEFSQLPWYADHPSDPRIRQETHFLEVVVPFVEKTYPVRAQRDARLLVGFSKSGWGAFSLLLRHPDRFGRAAAWDAPMMMGRPDKYGTRPIFGTQASFERYRIAAMAETRVRELRGSARLVLLGYANFREHHRALHARLDALGVPHVYRDGPERRHRWASGWLEEAVTHLASRAKESVLKVFILAGQSNMEGQAVVDLDHEEYYNGGRGTLARLLEDPAKAPRLAHLRDEKGQWVVRDDVRVVYRTGRGELKSGGLSIGYSGYPERHHFGPELQFGHVIGDRFEDNVLLIKTAWGGKSLHKDFRPPSAGGEVGEYYKKMLSEVRGTLANIGEHVPAYDGEKIELSGFVWFQGWNDMIDEKAAAEYEDNLVHLLGDVRRELDVPALPVVIAETGNCRNEKFREAQAATARRPELGGNVAFVPTAEFLRRASDSPNVGHGHHWFGNAESYFLIGDAMGKTMLDLLDPTGHE